MARIFIPYGSTEGQTAKIAEYLGEVIREQGYHADVESVTEAGPIPPGYDAVIVGASIHVGKHDKHVVDYVKHNVFQLERFPSAFFSVSLAAHGDTDQAEEYVEEFEKETEWRPDRVAVFAGALLYTQYGFIKRRMMRKIAKDKPGDLGTDTSRDYVYTEWDGVKQFAEDFLHDFVPRDAGEVKH